MSDTTVKKYIVKKGVRRPKDRLNSGLVGLFIILPAAILIFAWPLQMEKGGLTLPIIAAFFVGLGLMGTFNGINTYMAGESPKSIDAKRPCRVHNHQLTRDAEVRPSEKSEVVAAKYIMQYAFGAMSTAAIVPLIDAIGVGWAFTLCRFPPPRCSRRRHSELLLIRRSYVPGYFRRPLCPAYSTVQPRFVDLRTFLKKPGSPSSSPPALRASKCVPFAIDTTSQDKDDLVQWGYRQILFFLSHAKQTASGWWQRRSTILRQGSRCPRWSGPWLAACHCWEETSRQIQANLFIVL